MLAVVEGILGYKAEYDGVTINPCIPGTWQGFTFRKIFRNKTLNVTVTNPQGIEKGVKQVLLNDENIDSAIIPESKMKLVNEIKVIMGK